MRLWPDLLFANGREVSGHVVSIADGRITAVQPPSPADASASDVIRLPGKALLPGTVNAHCHTFQSLLRGLGDDLDFMAWRDRVLYPYSTRLDREGIYVGAAFALAEMLLHGATTCVDFFYLQDSGNENAEAVIRTARDVGIRLVLARTICDWDGAPARYRESPADAARRVRELIRAHTGDALVAVQPAPHSPHGASPARRARRHPDPAARQARRAGPALKSLVYAMSHQAVSDVRVHGRPVVLGQRLATMDQAGLMERVRALTHDWKPA